MTDPLAQLRRWAYHPLPWLIGIVAWMVMAMLVCPAIAQIQPGPNISPNGIPFTFSPRFGYLGPPAAFVFAPRPDPSRRYYQPGSMPHIEVPRHQPVAGPPVRPIEPPLVQRHPTRPGLWAPRQRPPLPCPDGCEREPD